MIVNVKDKESCEIIITFTNVISYNNYSITYKRIDGYISVYYLQENEYV